MYQDLNKNYRWSRMKKYIVEYVAKFLMSKQIKIEHQKSGGMLQPLKIPKWK